MLNKSALDAGHGRAATMGPAPTDGAVEDPFTAIPLIDDARLERLRAMIPAAALRGIIQSYIDSDFFAGLGEGLPADDADFPGMVHDCKGTSANLGAARLRAVAERLELACHTGDHGAMAWLLPELRQVTTLTRDAMAARLTVLLPLAAGDVRRQA